jgi:hypothetical protein
MRLTRLISALIILLVFGNTVFAQQYRLKKIESYKLTPYSNPSDFQKTDSSIFYYTGNRGGYYTPEFIAENLKTQGRRFNYLYEPNRIIKYDSICRNNWSDNNKTFYKYNIVQHFDNLNNVLYFKNTLSMGIFVRTMDSATYSYNGNWLVQSYGSYPGTQLYTYNASRQLERITNGSGIPYKTFTYNSNFLLQESIEYNTSGIALIKNNYYYNGSSILDSIVIQRYDGTVWYDANIRKYAYTTSPATTTESTFYSYGAKDPIQPGGRTISFFSTRNRLDSVYSQWYDGGKYTNHLRNRYYYNTLMLLDSVITDKWDGAQWADFSDTTGIYCHKHHFTYEPYFPTSISTAQNIQINLATYPNPATDIIHLNAELPAQAAVTIGIYDAQGRLLRKQDAPPTRQLRVQMVVADLPSGMYVLRIDGKDIAGSQQFVISR